MASKQKSSDNEVTESAGATVLESGAAEAAATASMPRHGFLNRLYTGTGAFEVVGRRKLWYGISLLIVAIAVASILLKGFTFGIDFQGGTKVGFPQAGANGNVTTSQVKEAFHEAIGEDPESVVIVGNGASATVQIRSETLSNEETEKLREVLFEKFKPKGENGEPSKEAISDSAVSETWGGQITDKALIALAVFIVIVAIYITVRYEKYMALASMAALAFDLITTAGVYSLVGFEVTPATVIGLLTILGFSLYDTVIVFDKVEENTHGFQHTTRRTYAEQANLAVNQTFMRSINTSAISVIPVLSLIVVAVWLLGVGTLKDLALIQFVGILVGTYSSIFFATPLLVSLRERTEMVRTHTNRVLKRRSATSAAGEASSGAADDDAVSLTKGGGAAGTTGGAAAANKPQSGARVRRPSSTRTGRPTGKNSSTSR